MTIWRLFLAVPIAVFNTQAHAANWIAVAASADGMSTSIDKDSIRRGSDGIVQFTDYDQWSDVSDKMAVNCSARVIYMVNVGDGKDFSDWRDKGEAVKPGSLEEKELQYVCANFG